MPDTLLNEVSGARWSREALDARRTAIACRHQEGASGTEIVTALTTLADDILLDLYRESPGQAQSEEVGLALVALGGYGRRELAPYSDIDLMFLYAPGEEQMARAISTSVLHALWDLGFQVGHSLRTVADCLAMGRADLTVRTSLMEARRLVGDEGLFNEFQHKFRDQIGAKGVQDFLVQKIEERRAEFGRFGSTNFLLEPNLKKSRGGLRDLHLLKWTALARYGTSSLETLVQEGRLSAGDAAALEEAQSFLWRARNELHFYAGRAQDILTFDEQIRIAGLWGYKDASHLLAVEQFMQQYYRHSTRVSELSGQFMSRSMIRTFRQRLLSWLPARQVEGFFALTREEISVPVNLREEFIQDGGRVLRLFHLAQMYGLSVSEDLVQDLTERVALVPDSAFEGEAVHRSFRAMLGGVGHVAATLVIMHRVRLLERIIPAFGRVRGLMQFNAYHKYTVDQHSLLAVERAEELARSEGMMGRVAQDIKRKDILHLAVLLHDLGKGQAEDHSLVGERLAHDAALRLGYDEHDTRLLVLLVRHHLLMANTAFRRDPSDEKVVLGFARGVGTPEALKMLYLLTAADISAVGPGVLTPWKETLLGELFFKTLLELTGDEELAGTAANLPRKEDVRQAVIQQVGRRLPLEWVNKQLDAWPDRYLQVLPAARIAAHLEWVARLTDVSVLVDTNHEPAWGTTEYTVYTRDALTPGIFSKIAGVLASKGVQIIDAQILTLADGVVVDAFRVVDADFPEGPHPSRISDICNGVAEVLMGRRRVDDLLQEAARFGEGRQGVPLREPTVVQVDNDTSDRYTIIDIFADDRQGLLYVIARAIFDMGLSVHSARISTKLDQVVDVFYVTDSAGAKIQDAGRCEIIRETVAARIEEFLSGGRNGRQVVHRGNGQRS